MVTGPNEKGKGWFTGGRVRDVGGDWPKVVAIGPKINDGGGAGAGAGSGWLSSQGAGRSTIVVGVVGGAVAGSCGEGGVMPVGAAVVASSFLFFLRSRLFLLFPFFSPSPPSSLIEASSFPISSCCCLTDSASGASRGKVLALIIIFDRFGCKVALMRASDG